MTRPWRALGRLREAVARHRPEPSLEAYLWLSAEVTGKDQAVVTPDHLRAARAALRERPSWDAEVLASAAWPKLALTGTWETAPPVSRPWLGEAMLACGRRVAECIGARLVRVPGAAQEPHREQAATVDAALRRRLVELS